MPDTVSDEEAVFTEPLAAALEIFQQLHMRPTTRALVIGDGKLGLLIAQVLAHFGTRVMLLGRNPKKLALAERWSIPSALADRNAPQALHFGGRFDSVVECTGSPEGLSTAMNHVVPGGTIVLKSTYAPTQPPTLDWAKIVIDEIRIVGSRCGPFAPALRLLAKGIVARAQSHKGLMEEQPRAYKNVDDVVDVVHQAGLSKKVARMRPIGVIKG